MIIKTALVVEDDSGIASLVKDGLEAAGFHVSVEKDGDAALKSLERRFPDVLITDLLLPTLPGFELLGALRRMPGGKGVPVIVMSGIYRSARHKKAAKETYGVKASFDKPFKLDEMVAVAKEISGAVAVVKKKAPSAAIPGKKPKAVPKETIDDEDDAFDTRKFVQPRGQRPAAVEFDKGGKELPATMVRGNLKQKRFPEILAQLRRQRVSGVLLLRRGRIKKIVYLDEGYPASVKSNLLSECLGRVLARERMISDDECERSLELLPHSNGKQQGEVLIEMGALSPHNLVFGLQLQLEQKLFDIFGWPDGDYQFNANASAPPSSVHLDMSLATIIYEGVRRKFSDEQVRDLLEPIIDLYVGVHPNPSQSFADLPLEADERTLVALIDGRHTMRDVVDKSGMKKTAANKLMYALTASELIQPLRRPLEQAAAVDFVRALEKPITPSAPPSRPPRIVGGPPSSVPPPLPKRKTTTAPTTAPTLAPTTTPPMLRRHNALGEPELVPAGLVDVVGVDELRARLAERARLLKRQNHFEALGVSQRASTEEIQRAYKAQSHDLHADRLRRAAGAALPADARALAEQLQHHLNQAFEILADDRRRADYLHKLDKSGRSLASEELTRLLNVDSRARRGEAALDNGQYREAAAAFEEAQALAPEEGELIASHAWALYQEAPDDPVVQADVITRLQRAVDLAPRWDRGWLWFGRVLQRAGRPGEAIKQFERALHINPDNREAQAELKQR